MFSNMNCFNLVNDYLLHLHANECLSTQCMRWFTGGCPSSEQCPLSCHLQIAWEHQSHHYFVLYLAPCLEIISKASLFCLFLLLGCATKHCLRKHCILNQFCLTGLDMKCVYFLKREHACLSQTGKCPLLPWTEKTPLNQC